MRFPTSLHPFEGRYFNLNGLHYHYLDEGRGEPAVMVHGNPVRRQIFSNACVTRQLSSDRLAG
jgi:haloalkane dehalogenase